jgi:hypothetical protein
MDLKFLEELHEFYAKFIDGRFVVGVFDEFFVSWKQELDVLLQRHDGTVGVEYILLFYGESFQRIELEVVEQSILAVNTTSETNRFVFDEGWKGLFDFWRVV